MLTPYKEFRPLRRATRAPPWTCRPLKRAALNFRPYEGVCGAKGSAWRLGLTGAAPIQPVKGRVNRFALCSSGLQAPTRPPHSVKPRSGE